MEHERIPGKIEYKIFPDNGPQQGDVKIWIEENGGKANLYDGCVENDVKTSTEAVWRWSHIYIESVKGFWPTIGDYIVKDVDGLIKAFNPEDFKKNFKPINP